MPAVSAPNGKIEFDAGTLSLPAPTFMARAAGTFTVPVGERFGLQADLSVSTAPGFVTSAALHGFTRDPAAYLIGGTLGFVRSPGATIVAAGPEAELYLGRWTLAAWGGLSLTTPIPAAPQRAGAFVMAGASYYVTDNWKLSLDLSTLDGYAAVQMSTEYLFDNFDLPLAVTAETRIGQDGAIRVMAGLRTYIGPDPAKTLIRRHREDDPADRGTALYAAAGQSTLNPPKPATPSGTVPSTGSTHVAATAPGQTPPSAGTPANDDVQTGETPPDPSPTAENPPPGDETEGPPGETSPPAEEPSSDDDELPECGPGTFDPSCRSMPIP